MMWKNSIFAWRLMLFVRQLYLISIRNVHRFSTLCNISGNACSPGNSYFLSQIHFLHCTARADIEKFRDETSVKGRKKGGKWIIWCWTVKFSEKEKRFSIEICLLNESDTLNPLCLQCRELFMFAAKAHKTEWTFSLKFVFHMKEFC